MAAEVAAAVCAGTAAALLPLRRVLPGSREELAEVLHRTGVKLVPKEELSRLGLALARAGLEVSPAQFAGFRVFLAGLFFLAVLPLLAAGADLFWLVVFLPLAWYAPVLWLNSRIAARRQEVKKSLPDFAVALSTALSAGATIDFALSKAAAAVGGPLQQEVERALKGQRFGLDPAGALEEMASRCDVDELRFLSRAVAHSYQYGAPLAESVRDFAGRMRQARRFEVQEAAGKLTVKVLFPILVFMLAPCLVVFAYPALVQLLQVFGV